MLPTYSFLSIDLSRQLRAIQDRQVPPVRKGVPGSKDLRAHKV
jgi:hypothetical protein